MDILQSVEPPRLDNCSRECILNYLENSWQLEDLLLKSIEGEDTFYLNSDSLRNPLIFYLGHSAVFYINKLRHVGLLEKPLNQEYEVLFEIGVDPETPEDLNDAIANIKWPTVREVWQYREQVYELLTTILQKVPLNLPIQQSHPLWGLMMGIEHQRIHFETSSMLIRQLPVELVKRPQNWQYAPSNGKIHDNEMVELSGGVVELGKPENYPIYGWDSEYGYRRVEVQPFAVSKYMITNAQFLEFVKAGGYENQEYWQQEAWNWKEENNARHPKFWIANNGGYQYRAMFDEIELPLTWPVEVNYYEAMAYCRWQGEEIRLMSEAEWHLASDLNGDRDTIDDYNLNLKFGSPSPVGSLEKAQSPSGIFDLCGNVWEWLNENFNPLPG